MLQRSIFSESIAALKLEAPAEPQLRPGILGAQCERRGCSAYRPLCGTAPIMILLLC